MTITTEVLINAQNWLKENGYDNLQEAIDGENLKMEEEDLAGEVAVAFYESIYLGSTFSRCGYPDDWRKAARKAINIIQFKTMPTANVKQWDHIRDVPPSVAVRDRTGDLLTWSDETLYRLDPETMELVHDVNADWQHAWAPFTRV